MIYLYQKLKYNASIYPLFQINQKKPSSKAKDGFSLNDEISITYIWSMETNFHLHQRNCTTIEGKENAWFSSSSRCTPATCRCRKTPKASTPCCLSTGILCRLSYQPSTIIDGCSQREKRKMWWTSFRAMPLRSCAACCAWNTAGTAVCRPKHLPGWSQTDHGWPWYSRKWYGVLTKHLPSCAVTINWTGNQSHV